MEQAGYAVNASRSLLDYKDIDNTINSFVSNFKDEFLIGFPSLTSSDKLKLVKHIQDLYRSKGSIQSIELLFKLLFNENANIYNPSDDILRASDGEWTVPTYLEVDNFERASGFIGKEIVGSSSGAVAFVESVIQKRVAGKFITVIYLSNIKGDFTNGEKVSNDGLFANAPTIIGSLTQINITEGGANNSVGDLFNIYSSDVTSNTGLAGQAKVIAVTDGTGRVSFKLVDGGTGYTTSANVYVSNTVFGYTNQTTTNGFSLLETIKQPLASYQYVSGSGLTSNAYSTGDLVTGHYSNNTISGNGYVVASAKASNTNGTIVISVTNGSFNNTSTSWVSLSTNTSANSQTSGNTLDVSATGLLIGSNTSNTPTSGFVGLTSVSNTFYPTGWVYGTTSNSNGILQTLSTGSGATFKVGSVSADETLSLYTDLTGSNNINNVPLAYVTLNGSNSGVILALGQGTLTCNTTSPIVTGIGSGFLADLAAVNYSNGGLVTAVSTSNVVTASTPVFGGVFPGYNLYTSSNVSLIGTVSAVANTTRLTLVNNSNFTITTNNMVYTNGNVTPVNIFASNGTYIGTVNTVTTNTALTLSNNGLINMTSGAYEYNYGGFGFPKNPSAGLYNIISDALNVNTYTLGTIASISGINPGQNYNITPFVLVRDNLVAGFNKRYFNLNINNSTGTFNTGDDIQQTLGASGISFSIGTQLGTATSGTVVANTTSANVTGTGTTFTSNIVSGYTVYANNGATALGVVANVTNNTLLTLTSLASANSVANVLYFSSASSWSNNEAVYQPSTKAYGTISSIVGSAVAVTNIIGSFSNTGLIYGLGSKRTATPTTVINSSAIIPSTFQKGTVISANSTNIYVKRTMFNTDFIPGVVISDAETLATANIVSASQDGASPLMGNNSTVSANVTTATGIATALQIYSSGYGYSQTTREWQPNISYNAGDKVLHSGLYYVALIAVPISSNSPDQASNYWSQYSDLTLYGESNTNALVITGNALLQKQGKGVGYWKNNKGKLSSDKYLHDNEYYQEFSYEVQSSKSLDKYADILKRLVHVAGTHMFAKVIEESEITGTITSPGVTISVDGVSASFSYLLDFSTQINSQYLTILPV